MAIVIISSSIILIPYYNYWRIILAVKKGKYPLFIIDFPVCETTQYHYLKAKEKVELFSNLVKENQKNELKLN